MKRIFQNITVVTFAVFVMVGVVGCGTFVDDERVARAVEKQGYRDVKINSKHIVLIVWYGCGKDDAAAFEVTALNSAGQRVDITACAGWPFKGVTVRTQ